MNDIYKLSFTLFDGEEGGDTASTAEPEQDVRRIQYGKSTGSNGDANSQVGSDNEAVDLEAEFAELVGKGGKYHDIYGQKVSGAIERRFKNQQDTQKELDRITDSFSTLFARYDIEPGDFDGLQDALSRDDALFETAAERAGLSVDQYKQNLKLKVDADRGRRIQEQIQEQQRYNEQVAQWETEAEELRQYFPHFDLGLEMQYNEQFVQYLDMGVPVHDAFYLTHREEIMRGQNDAVSRQATQKVVNTIQQRQTRPTEGAMTKAPAIVRKSIPSQLTKEDWDELDRRVEAGEEIAF